MNIRIIVNCFYLSLLILRAVAKRNFLMKISNIHCHSKTPIVDMTCNLTKSNRVAGFNMYAQLTEDIYDLKFNLELLHFNKKTSTWKSVYKFTQLNVCEFLSAKFSLAILVIIRNLMRKFSNFPEKCPIRKDKLYYVKGMRLDPEVFPPYFPEGQFSATGVIYNKESVFIEYALGVSAVQKKFKF